MYKSVDDELREREKDHTKRSMITGYVNKPQTENGQKQKQQHNHTLILMLYENKKMAKFAVFFSFSILNVHFS